MYLNKTFMYSEKGTHWCFRITALLEGTGRRHGVRVESLCERIMRKPGKTVGGRLFTKNLGSQANTHHFYKMASRELCIVQ